jgi:hypothetical protein
MMMDPTQRSQVEEALERTLTHEELVVVADLAALPTSHLDVVEQLYRRNAIVALYYLRAVTDGINPSVLRNYVHDFDNFIARRDKRPALFAQRHYESVLGRELTADELVGAPSLESLPRAQRDVVRALARKDRSYALAYLRNLVPHASWQAWHDFVDSLLEAK